MRDRPAQLLLVDHDPVFRLGFKLWLKQFADLQVVADVATGTEALRHLAANSSTPSEPSAVTDITATSGTDGRAAVNLVILDLGLGRLDTEQIPGFSLCQQIKDQFPQTSVLLLSDRAEPVIQAAARQAGADGFCLRETPLDDLLGAVRQVARGRSYWPAIAPPTPSPPSQRVASTVSPSPPPIPTPSASDPSPAQSRPGLFYRLRSSLRQSGVAQIEAELRGLDEQLQRPDLDWLTRSIWAGRRRELRASRWLVNRLLATPARRRAPEPEPRSEQSGQQRASSSGQVGPRLRRGSESDSAARSQLPQPDSSPSLPQVIPQTTAATSLRSLESLILDAAFSRLQGSLRNRMEIPLEIDILQPEKKRQLLYTVLRQLTQLLEDLRQSQLQSGQFYDKQEGLLRDLWRATITEFFGKYYMVSIGSLQQEIIPILLEDEETVYTETLSQIPLVDDLLAHLLFQSPLMVDGSLRTAGSPEALTQVEYLLDNLLIRVANAVIQPLLNHFADAESIKRDFYDYRLLSTREIERFRNDLSWRYRMERYVREPQAIFESQYRLLILTSRGIQRQAVYAPRRQELEQLSGVPYWVTVALEFRDAVSPRVRAVVSFVGSGVIYVLTEVIGRGIGLIGRGILQGIGSAWQDSRFSRSSERQR